MVRDHNFARLKKNWVRYILDTTIPVFSDLCLTLQTSLRSACHGGDGGQHGRCAARGRGARSEYAAPVLSSGGSPAGSGGSYRQLPQSGYRGRGASGAANNWTYIPRLLIGCLVAGA